jgi:large subunit ribosomal protein L15
MLTLNTIKAQPGAHRDTKRLGRGAGSGRGGTAGKGHKGQLARSGGTARPGFEGGQTPMYRRIPKRGFTNVLRASEAVVNLADIALAGLKEVSLESLRDAGVIKGRYQRLRVLGVGEIKSSINVKAYRVSASAEEKIKKAGGSIQLVTMPKLVREKKQKTNAKK